LFKSLAVKFFLAVGMCIALRSSSQGRCGSFDAAAATGEGRCGSFDAAAAKGKGRCGSFDAAAAEAAAVHLTQQQPRPLRFI
jgi:hypothetical protein